MCRILRGTPTRGRFDRDRHSLDRHAALRLADLGDDVRVAYGAVRLWR
ncbi:MAG: hypothetical protein ACRDQ2_04565 [Gaiellales bacterium]